jgi:hypothetical protein
LKVTRWLGHVLLPNKKRKAHNVLGENPEVKRPLASLGMDDSLILN